VLTRWNALVVLRHVATGHKAHPAYKGVHFQRTFSSLWRRLLGTLEDSHWLILKADSEALPFILFPQGGYVLRVMMSAAI